MFNIDFLQTVLAFIGGSSGSFFATQIAKSIPGFPVKMHDKRKKAVMATAAVGAALCSALMLWIQGSLDGATIQNVLGLITVSALSWLGADSAYKLGKDKKESGKKED